MLLVTLWQPMEDGSWKHQKDFLKLVEAPSPSPVTLLNATWKCVGGERGGSCFFIFFGWDDALSERDCCECSPVLVWASLKTEQGNEVYTAVRTIWIRHWEELSPRRGWWREGRLRFKPHQYYLLPISPVPLLQPSWSSFCPLNMPLHLLSSLPCLTFPLTTGSFRY